MAAVCAKATAERSTFLSAADTAIVFTSFDTTSALTDLSVFIKLTRNV